jgi:hypothetical protein
MNPHDYSLTLRLRHPSIDPAELSRHIGLEPQHAWRAGEAKPHVDGEPDTGAYRETYWVGVLLGAAPQTVRLPGRSEPVDVGDTAPIGLLLLTVSRMKRDRAFWRTFAAEGGSIECLLQVHQPERFYVEFTPALIGLLAEHRIALSLATDAASAHAAAA